jgi:DNA-binding CsgD family transcriptional regulator
MPLLSTSLTKKSSSIELRVDRHKFSEQIAEHLLISGGTVRRHLENAYAKLGVHTRTAASAPSRATPELGAAALCRRLSQAAVPGREMQRQIC